MLATLADLKALIGHAGSMARQWAERIYDGEIAAKPLCDKRRNGACDRCDYAPICRRDLSRGIDNARMMQEMKFDELLEKINKPLPFTYQSQLQEVTMGLFALNPNQGPEALDPQ